MNVIDFLKSLPFTEPHEDYLNSPICYPLLNLLAKDFRMTRILEVGVRLGYSAVAFIYGNEVSEYVGIDNDTYVPDSLARARRNLEYVQSAREFTFRLYKRDTQALTDLSFLGSQLFDCVYIDGDHTYAGALNDLRLFWGALCVGGHMLVDDTIHMPSVLAACVEFAAGVDEPWYEIKSFRGTAVFSKTK